VPTLHHLWARGAGALLGHEPTGLRELGRALCPERPGHNLGSLLGGLRVLGLNGWVALDGRDEDTAVRLTNAGAAVAATWAAHRATFDRLVGFLGHARDLPALLHEPGGEDAAAAFEDLVARSRRGWDIADPPDGAATAAVAGLRRQMDGVLVSPAMVALGIPVHRQDADAIRVARPALFEEVDASGRLSLRRLGAGWNGRLLRTALVLLAQQGLLERAPDDPAAVRLTDRGRLLVADAANFGGPVSYLANYSRLDDVLLGSGDPLGIASDGHVDRVMNIWTSYEHSVFSMGRTDMCAGFVRRIFDDPDLDAQPVGIADMGCGSGDSVRQLVDYVLRQTRRGRHLATHPLAVIGADYYEAPRARARAAFQAFAAQPGVQGHVVAADVSDPDAYEETIRELGMRTLDRRTGRRRRVGAADFVHTMMFLTHDRELRITDRDRAVDVLRRAALATDRETLAKALAPLTGSRELPDDDESLAALVVEQFTTAHSDRGPLVPAAVSAADLVQFMSRWRPYLAHGLLLLEVHVLRASEVAAEGPLPEAAQPSAAAWGVHFASRQFLLPRREHELALTLAGFRAREAHPVVSETLSVGWWIR